MTIDEAYLAIKENDLNSFKEFMNSQQPYSTRPQLAGQLQSLLGYAIDKEKIDFVEYMICDAGVPKNILNNWYVKWSYWIKPNYKIWKFLTEQCNDKS